MGKVAWAVCCIAGSLAMLFIQPLASAREVESRIARVCIYPDSAMVTRQVAVQVSPGVQDITLPALIPEIDENSLRASVDAQSDIKILQAKIKKEFREENPSEKIRELKDEIQRLEDQIRNFNSAKAIYTQERSFLDSVKLFSDGQIPKDLVTKIPSIKDLDDLLRFLDLKYKENTSAVTDCDLNIRDVNKKLEVARRELSQISGPNRKLVRSIVLSLEAKKGVDAVVEVSYLVGGANWEPMYDARADFEKSAVELVSFGIVRQRTGEPWQNVEISLSTARPSLGGRMPEVVPWILQPIMPHKGMRKERSFLGNMVGELKTADFSGQAEATMPALAPPQETQVAEKGIAVVYTIPRKATVVSDGSDHKLEIIAQTLKANFEYSSFPRAIPSAFLGSTVTNAPNLQLLAGRVNIFLDGDYVGSSGIDSIGPGEEFELSLGVDESVKVKREMVEKKMDDTLIGGIPSPNKKTVLKYKISVENYKTRPITVHMYEAMPVSQDDKIKVKFGQISIEPKQRDWKDKKGVCQWNLELTPKEKKEIVYSYIVEHPRDMVLEGL